MIVEKATPISPKATSLRDRFSAVRGFTERLCEPLSAEDCAIQSMPDVSPTRWHLAHTTWFFETFVLSGLPSYRVFDDKFTYLFNSYYNAVGKQFPRAKRGHLSRPGLDRVLAYRQYVDEHMLELLTARRGLSGRLALIVEIGLHHEQQHQELVLTDIKHVLSCNPLFPAYADMPSGGSGTRCRQEWSSFDEGVYWVGHDGEGFAYDNESPRHRVFLEAFDLSNTLVTCGQYLEFIEDRGYERPELWLSLGWQTVGEEGWKAPLYWVPSDDGWHQFTLAGLRELDLNEPVTHISFFEADAFARWAGARLPSEAEWEVVAVHVPVSGHFADTLLDSGKALHPSSETIGGDQPRQLFGDVWEWTVSPYVAYPGYQAPAGALGEYNGKFMCNQYVLRGGSCATPSAHIRSSYRNFFPPEARWQFSGLRLSRSR